VHPLNTEVVDYLTQRTESMMALGYLLTMYAAVRAVTAVRGQGMWQAVAVAACALGMLCKESMATAPLMVVLFDRAFVFDSFADALRRRWRLYAALAATWIVVIYSVTTASRELSGGYATTHVSAWSYLLNQTVVITHYLQLVVWPQALVAYYGWSLPATLSTVLPYAVLIVAAFVASVAAVVRWPRIGFLALWFFITLAPTSSILPVAAEVGADRRMYVPLAGLVALAVVAGWMVLERRARAIGVALAGVVCLALGARTLARNADYATELQLSETTLAAWPSGAAHDMVGLSLVKLGRQEEAVHELRQAVVDYAPAGYDLGAQLFKLGQFDEAAGVLQHFVVAEPGMFTTSAAHTLMGRVFISQHRPADAIRELELALKGVAPDPQAHALLAELLMDQQQYAGAIGHYRAYISTAPADGQAWGNLGIALASANRPGDAVAAFQRAAELQPMNAGAHENLARMLLETGQASAADAEARRALALVPASAAAYDLLGQALVIQQRLPDARAAFERAIQLEPGFADAREHLRRLGK
jgi:tetratricopeptide (TPR) repeat protein